MTQRISTLEDLRAVLSAQPSTALGFVPTMGALHAGHEALLSRAVAENQITLLSIFVNPTQFDDPNDYQQYPINLARDIEIAESLGIDYCFAPSDPAILYPDHYTYQVMENTHSLLMEGAMRPGHFNGMLTVVLKLLLLIRPRRLYLGEKDYQQLTLIQGMAAAFFLDVEIIGCPTVRDAQGLALSSRHARLNAAEKALAYRFAQHFHTCETIEALQKALDNDGIQIEYIHEINNRRYIAVKIGDIRLIDNKEIPPC